MTILIDMNFDQTPIGQRYQILDTLGSGGMGITYRAKDLHSETLVALKIIPFSQVSDWKMVDLFVREVKVLKQLNHPAIPKYLDSFEVDHNGDRLFCIVQALAPGKTLAQWVQDGWRPGETEVVAIANQLLNILTYLQTLTPPIIHRDIKPQNILKDEQGNLFLVDFGAVQDTYRQTLTGGSTVVGTFGYMAPEQFRGQATLSTDLYGLGTTIAFLLTGQDPIHLQNTEELKLNLPAELSISLPFRNWLEKIIEPALEDRYASAEEAMLALQGQASFANSTQVSYLRPPNTSIDLLKTDHYLRIRFLPRHFRHPKILRIFAVLLVCVLSILAATVLHISLASGYVKFSHLNPWLVVFTYMSGLVSVILGGRAVLILIKPVVLIVNEGSFNIQGTQRLLANKADKDDISISLDVFDEVRLQKSSFNTFICQLRTVEGDKYQFGQYLSVPEQRWIVFEIQEFIKNIKDRTAHEHQRGLKLLQDRKQNSLDLLLHNGVDLYLHTQVGASITLFEAALILDHNCAEAHNNLGVILFQQQKTSKAVKALQTALNCAPEYWIARMNLAIIYKQQGNQEGFTKILSQQPPLNSIEDKPQHSLTLVDRANGTTVTSFSSFIEENFIHPSTASLPFQIDSTLLEKISLSSFLLSIDDHVLYKREQGKRESKKWQQNYVLHQLKGVSAVQSDDQNSSSNVPKKAEKDPLDILDEATDRKIAHQDSPKSQNSAPSVKRLPRQLKVSSFQKTPETQNDQDIKSAPSNLSGFHDRFDRIMTTKRGLFLVPIVCLFLTIKILPTFYIWVWLLLPLGGMIYRTVRLKGNKFKTFGSSFLVALLSFIVPRSFIAEARYTVGSVMEPTLPNQSRFIVDKTSYITTNPNRGDIVIFKMAKIYSPDSRVSLDYQGSSQEVKVSRIIGLAGETVEIKNGHLFINGRKQQQSYFSNVQSNILAQYNLSPFKVPSNFVLYKDDLRRNGQSVTGETPPLGLIPRNSIVGKATAVFYPFENSKRL
jgi:eukaryotic-like serine/threonine-protein kinase